MDLEGLKNVYAISEARSNAILEQILRKFTYKKSAAASPKAIMIGGQPGSGKTELEKLAKIELLNNAVICNVDHMRDFHPLAAEIQQYHPQEYGAITNDIAHHWNKELCKYCRRENLNYIIETTFKGGQGLNDTIQATKDAGFQVDIKLLAVNPKLSKLGIYLRFESMMELYGRGRTVPIDVHDTMFQAIPHSIQKVKEAELYNNFSIYARSVVLEGTHLKNGVTLVAHNPHNPRAAYQAEIDRCWPPKLERHFAATCRKVLSLMDKRNAPEEEKEVVKNSLGISELSGIKSKRKSFHI
ncbi:zeta toxin family protein [Olivibacter domesticus]|uniref:Predicted ABC-type ATPase n=1 Tax=Olivibacter domesticus TaxID=407022 RepID=A0A1H7I7A6_OLID1|nr:zeta toxin family protein [Olivibacter domesticus]SEK58453.1 Predicted ABC-type ATPase [Olivibacter domesticus]